MRYDTKMAIVRQRVDPVRLLWRRVAIFALFLVLCTALWALWGVWGKEQESLALKQQAEGHLADMQARYDQLAADVASLKTDRGQEGVLRDNYDVGKPGEGLIVIVDEKPTPTSTETAPKAVASPWWKFW